MNNWHPNSKAEVTAFACGERVFTVAEVIHAAHFRGETEQHWEALLRSQKSAAKAEELDLSVDEAELQHASEEFRLERDLITAEETEQWLLQRGLTEDDFSDHFVRRFWAARFPAVLSPDIPCSETPEAALRDLLRIELLLSGAYDEMAQRLAERVAADESPDGKTCASGLIAEERRRFMHRHGLDEGTLAPWLSNDGFDQRQLDEFLRLEAVYRAHCQTLLTHENLMREVNSHRIEFTQADVEMMELDSTDTAHEALLCAREDGEPLQEVARRGSYPFRRSRLLLAELSGDWRQRLLCAAAGEVLDPMARGEGFELCRIIAKIEPSLADTGIRQHAEKRILQQHFSALTASHIRWLI